MNRLLALLALLIVAVLASSVEAQNVRVVNNPPGLFNRSVTTVRGGGNADIAVAVNNGRRNSDVAVVLNNNRRRNADVLVLSDNRRRNDVLVLNQRHYHHHDDLAAALALARLQNAHRSRNTAVIRLNSSRSHSHGSAILLDSCCH